MVKNILFVIAFAMLCVPALAQTNAMKKSEITKIKKSDSYIYAEATLPTAADAKALAEELLYNEINSWTATQIKMLGKKISVKDCRTAVQEIELPRGNMFRAFMYVRKKDIIAEKNTVASDDNVASNDNTADAPTPTVQEEQLPEAVAQVVKVQKFNELKPLITSLKQSGKIADYNLYSALQNPTDYYLIVCNRQQDVVAVLTPDNGGRKNLKNGEPDSVDNYTWHGATIAFKLK